MEKIKIFFIALTLSACQTKYQPISSSLQGFSGSSGTLGEIFSGGYSDLKLNHNTYRISVQGNTYTSPEHANNIALLRAAELTLQNGAERFIILDGDVSNKVAGVTPVVTSVTGGGVTPITTKVYRGGVTPPIYSFGGQPIATTTIITPGAKPITTITSGGQPIPRRVVRTGGEAIIKPSGEITIQTLTASDPEFATAFEARLIQEQLRKQLIPQ